MKIVGVTFTCATSVVGTSNPTMSSLFSLNLIKLPYVVSMLSKSKDPTHTHPLFKIYQTRDTEERQKYCFQSAEWTLAIPIGS